LKGLTVAENTNLDVVMPIYRLATGANSSADLDAALELWTPPLYQEDMRGDVLTRRDGASLTLLAGRSTSSAADMASVTLSIGKGAVITVDPTRTIKLAGIGQITVDGTLNAFGGKIDIAAVDVAAVVANPVNGAGHGRSIWIGEHAVLDVAGRAYTAVDP